MTGRGVGAGSGAIICLVMVSGGAFLFRCGDVGVLVLCVMHIVQIVLSCCVCVASVCLQTVVPTRFCLMCTFCSSILASFFLEGGGIPTGSFCAHLLSK